MVKFFQVRLKRLFVLVPFLIFFTLSPFQLLVEAQVTNNTSHINFSPHIFNQAADHAKKVLVKKSGTAVPFIVNTGKTISPLNDSNNTPPLQYLGGNTMHTQNVYLIFWNPSKLSDQSTSSYMKSTYSSIVSQFYNDIKNDSSSTYYKILSQYYDNVNGHITGTLAFDPSSNVVIDTDTFPNSDCSNSASNNVCINDSDLQNEIATVASNYHFGTGLNSLFVVYTPKNQGTCDSQGNCVWVVNNNKVECGWHNVFTDQSGLEYIYGAIPYNGAGDGAVCEPSYAPSGDFEDYASINTSSHEMMEAATDPERPWDNILTVYDAWAQSARSGPEIGDLCQSTFPPATIDSTTGISDANNDSDIVINGDYYFIQNEWSNYVLNSGYNTGCTLTSPANAILHGTFYQTKTVTTGSYPNQTTTVSIVATNAGDGTNRWDSANVSGGYKTTANNSHQLYQSDPVVDKVNGLLYIEVYNVYNGTTDLLAINVTTGKVEHDFNTSNLSAYTTPVLDSSSNIYVFGIDHKIYCYAKDGTSPLSGWPYATTISAVNPQFTIDPSANVLYYGSDDGYLYGMYDQKATNPHTAYASFYNSYYGKIYAGYAPALDAGGYVYFGVKGGTLYNPTYYILSVSCTSHPCTMNWHRQIITASSIYQLNVSGTILFVPTQPTGANASFYALKVSDGSNQWSSAEPVGNTTSVSLGSSQVYLNGTFSSLVSYDQTGGTQYLSLSPYGSTYSVPVVNTIGTTDTLFCYANIYTNSTTHLVADYALNSDGSVRFHWDPTNLSSNLVLSLGAF